MQAGDASGFSRRLFERQGGNFRPEKIGQTWMKGRIASRKNAPPLT